MTRITEELRVNNALGLHARPAALLVQTACQFKSEIWLSKGAHRVNGKSIMGVMSLGAPQGSKVKVEVEGEDARELLSALEALFHDRFQEG